jgi:Tat protein translocase TatB subunit
MFGLGFSEILIILVLALIFIGPKKLPEMAKNIGKGLREFQRAKQGLFDDIQSDINESEREIQKTAANATRQDEDHEHEYRADIEAEFHKPPEADEHSSQAKEESAESPVEKTESSKSPKV